MSKRWKDSDVCKPGLSGIVSRLACSLHTLYKNGHSIGAPLWCTPRCPTRIPQSVPLHSHWGVHWDVSGKSFGSRVHRGFLWGNGNCTQSQNESTGQRTEGMIPASAPREAPVSEPMTNKDFSDFLRLCYFAACKACAPAARAVCATFRPGRPVRPLPVRPPCGLCARCLCGLAS